MKKKILTGAAVGVASVIGALASITSANTVDTADVLLTISGGNISIGVTGSLDLGTFTVSDVDQTTEGQFAGGNDNHFWVKDLKGADAGYYTTVQASDMTGPNGTIAKANIAMKVDPATVSTLDGTANTAVVLDAAWSAYRDAGTAPLTFIKRDTAANAGKIGLYGVLPFVQVTIPAYQPVGAYTSTITYTLIEN